MARPDRKLWIKRGIKAVLAALVLVAVGRHLLGTWRQLHAEGRTVRIEVPWLLAGGAIYLAGLAMLGVFFARVLRHSATPVGLAAAVRAYLISHLGKYVPGKALVVVMRAALVTPYGARPATAAFATLYETLTMMAAGGLIAALGFVSGPGPWQLAPMAVSLGLGAGFLLLVQPEVFPRLSALFRLPFKGVGPDALPRLSRGLMAEGLLWAAGGWVLLGLSQLAVVRALEPSWVDPSKWPLLVASVALATVAGFAVAVLPGGLGVREWVLMTTLAPAVGRETADLSAIALRLAWVVAELAAAAVLAAARPPLPATGSPEP